MLGEFALLGLEDLDFKLFDFIVDVFASLTFCRETLSASIERIRFGFLGEDLEDLGVVRSTE